MTEESKDIIVEKEDMVDVSEETTQSPIDKGIVLYHNPQGQASFQLIGNVNLENLTYYKRYLEKIEDGFWKQEFKNQETQAAQEGVE